MDTSDEATAYEERQRDEAIARRKKTIKACGWCHNCSESLGSGEIFVPKIVVTTGKNDRTCERETESSENETI